MQAHDATGTIAWGMRFERNGETCFGNIVQGDAAVVVRSPRFRFASVDHADVEASADPIHERLTLSFEYGVEFFNYEAST